MTSDQGSVGLRAAARDVRGIFLSFRRSGSIGRLASLNFIGATIPAVIGLALLPMITRGLGIERYGLLALSLALLEFGSFFALGLGPATVKHVAESLARRDGEALHLVFVSASAQAVLGLAGGAAIAGFATVLATQVFTVPGDFRGEGVALFQVVGLLLPATLVLGTLLGALEGARRFGYSNLIRVPVSSATFVVPAVMLGYTTWLPAIVGALVAVRLTFCVIAAVAVRSVLFSESRGRWSPSATLKRLLSFGAWISASSVLSSLLVYGERLMLGASAGVRATGLYAAPLDALLRVLVVPSSLIRALVPTVTAEYTRGRIPELRSLFSRGVWALTLLLAPPLLLVAATAPSLLELWLGPEFAAGAGTATRLLAVGVLLNALAQVPASFLIAIGRPDILTKFHVAEAIVYVPLAWWLIVSVGVTGAAIAWAARSATDMGLLFLAAQRTLGRAATPRLTTPVPGIQPAPAPPPPPM